MFSTLIIPTFILQQKAQWGNLERTVLSKGNFPLDSIKTRNTLIKIQKSKTQRRSFLYDVVDHSACFSVNTSKYLNHTQLKNETEMLSMLNNKLGMKLKQGLSLNITEDNYTLSKVNHTRDISQRRIFFLL
jgi:hypothetical protein